jgi:hypothetical protein
MFNPSAAARARVDKACAGRGVRGLMWRILKACFFGDFVILASSKAHWDKLRSVILQDEFIYQSPLLHNYYCWRT